MNIEETLVEKFLNERVVYAKSGGRKGWGGTVRLIDDKTVTVDFDNGVSQEYSCYAFIKNPKSHYDTGYIKLESEFLGSSKSDSGTLPVGKFLVTRNCGEVLETFENEEMAQLWATEQVQESQKFIKLNIFRKTLSISSKSKTAIVTEED